MRGDKGGYVFYLKRNMFQVIDVGKDIFSW